MPRSYVRDDGDLPENDLILELPGSYSALSCHIRHYVNADAHVVIVGEFADGASGIVFAEPIAREVAEAVVPPGREFTMVAYAPQHPLSSKPDFHEVTFELDESVRRPSAAVFAGPRGALPHFRPLDLDAVEALTGSMVVVPYDGHGLVRGVESATALWYALEHPHVPCLLAYDHADARELADYERFGIGLAKVERSSPWDLRHVRAAVEAVDQACAAYECLHPSAGRASRPAT